MTTTIPPRDKTRKKPKWAEGDLVQVNGVRWVIRLLKGRKVELEATSTAAGMWWRTTVDRLPEKVSGR